MAKIQKVVYIHFKQVQTRYIDTLKSIASYSDTWLFLKSFLILTLSSRKSPQQLKTLSKGNSTQPEKDPTKSFITPGKAAITWRP